MHVLPWPGALRCSLNPGRKGSQSNDVQVVGRARSCPRRGGAGGSIRTGEAPQKSTLEALLLRADRDVRTLQLNFYKKARFANSFKWRLIENGVEPDEANTVTQSLILHLAQNEAGAAAHTSAPGNRAGDADPLLARAHAAFAAADWARAVELYDEFVAQHPDRSDVLNSLGVALCSLGRYQEAEQRYREAIDVNPEYAEALSNLAGLRQGSPRKQNRYCGACSR